MRHLLPPLSLYPALVALSGFLASSLAASELVPLNEFVTENDFSQNFTITAGFPGLSLVHSDDEDFGIGRGGFVTIPSETGGNTNLVYDTDGTGGTQTFGDFTMTIDHQPAHSVGFIVRGNSARNDSIRLLFTGGSRVRIGKGAGVNEHGWDEVIYDETDGAVASGWSHLRLDVRNAGESSDQVELVFRAYNSQVRFDETTLATEHTYTLSVEDSAPYLGAGEVGFRVLGTGTRIDNFAVYDNGTAPDTRLHPVLTDFHPAPGALVHRPEEGLTFRALSFGQIDISGISVSLNGSDVSGSLEISGDGGDRTVYYPNLVEDTDYLVEVQVETASGEITSQDFEFRSEIPTPAVPLVDLIEFADEAELTDNFTTVSGGMTYVADWDGGIGDGGMVRNSGNTNFIYDTDGTEGTQTFQDFSITVDHRIGGSLAFIIRANRGTDESIRVMLGGRNRIRIWSGSNISGTDSGTLHLDETLPSDIPADEWSHMQLDVRNIGDEWDAQIEMTLSAFASQNDFAAPGFRKTFTLSDAWNYTEAGEVGFRAIHGTSDIDNFAIYEYGKAPYSMPHPTIQNVSPAPSALEVIESNSTLSFEVSGTAGTPESGIQVWLNGVDVSADLAFTGDEFERGVTYEGLQPGTDVYIEAANPEATTTAFFEYAPSEDQIDPRPFTIYDAGGFEDASFFPLGDLQNVDHKTATWVAHETVPSEIVEAEQPFNQVLRRTLMDGGPQDWLYFPGRTSGILVLEMDVRASTTAVRTLDLSFTEVGVPNRQNSFIAWGAVADQFCYYDGSAWVPLFEPGSDWHHYRLVNYLSGPHMGTFDMIIDGELVGEKLSFRHTFNPDVHELSAIRLHATSGSEDVYIDIDNLVLSAQPLFGADQLPVSIVRELSPTGAGYSISFDTHAGHNYIVEYTDSLTSGEWVGLDSVVGDGGVMVIEDPTASSARRFYRIATVPSLPD